VNICVLSWGALLLNKMENSADKQTQKLALQHEPAHAGTSGKTRELIEVFLKNNRTRYGEMVKALEEGNIKAAHRIAHNLKSNAGFFGEKPLQNAAAEAENLLKGGNNITKPQMAVLETELNAVLSRLTLEFEELCRSDTAVTGCVNADKKPLDRAAALELLEKLEAFIKTGNLESLNFTGDIGRLPGDETLKGELLREIDDFEFESAFVTLGKLRKSIR